MIRWHCLNNGHLRDARQPGHGAVAGVGQRLGEPVELGDHQGVPGTAGGERFASAGSSWTVPVSPWSTYLRSSATPSASRYAVRSCVSVETRPWPILSSATVTVCGLAPVVGTVHRTRLTGHLLLLLPCGGATPSGVPVEIPAIHPLGMRAVLPSRLPQPGLLDHLPRQVPPPAAALIDRSDQAVSPGGVEAAAPAGGRGAACRARHRGGSRGLHGLGGSAGAGMGPRSW